MKWNLTINIFRTWILGWPNQDYPLYKWNLWWWFSCLEWWWLKLCSCWHEWSHCPSWCSRWGLHSVQGNWRRDDNPTRTLWHTMHLESLCFVCRNLLINSRWKKVIGYTRITLFFVIYLYMGQRNGSSFCCCCWNNCLRLNIICSCLFCFAFFLNCLMGQGALQLGWGPNLHSPAPSCKLKH